MNNEPYTLFPIVEKETNLTFSYHIGLTDAKNYPYAGREEIVCYVQGHGTQEALLKFQQAVRGKPLSCYECRNCRVKMYANVFPPQICPKCEEAEEKGETVNRRPLRDYNYGSAEPTTKERVASVKPKAPTQLKRTWNPDKMGFDYE